eukprot:3310549-Rhodomonas_salina.2
MMSFMLLGTYGIQFTLKGRFVEKDRRKRGPIQQESTEEILTVAANPPHAALNNFHFVFGWPDSATFELQKMQEDLAGKQVEFVPVPGKQHVDTNTREYLTKELEGLRESEVGPKKTAFCPRCPFRESVCLDTQMLRSRSTVSV